MRTNRVRAAFVPDEIEKARQMDLLTYLQNYEPENLVRISDSVYCTKEHDSLKISNGKWFWWSQGFGGVSALDYLIKVKEYRFGEAVETLLRRSVSRAAPPATGQNDMPKVLQLPRKNGDNNRAIRYLLRRGIDQSILSECIQEGLIYESADYHNVIFVGKDGYGAAKYAACRGTVGSYKRDISGSDKRFSFRLLAEKTSASVHVFEAAIDLLSYATLLKDGGKDYKRENLLSLSGIYQPKKGSEDIKIPIALTSFLKENPQVQTILLHLDNDEKGRNCAEALKKELSKHYFVIDKPPPAGKDVNDFLMLRSRNVQPVSHRADRRCR